MGLEQAHRNSLRERPHHPDEPQPIKWTGRRRADWSLIGRRDDLNNHYIKPTGRHRKPWGRRTKPWTLTTAETDEAARNPRSAAA